MVECDLPNGVVPNEIRPAVADLTNVNFVLHEDGGSHRRSHPAALGNHDGQVVDGFVRRGEGFEQGSGDIVVGAVVVVRYYSLERKLARDLSGCMTAHSVGNCVKIPTGRK